MTVEWRDVVGYETLYAVSSDGQVRESGGDVLPIRISHHGYPTIRLRGKRCFVHSTMLEAFIGPRPSPTHESRHLNDVKTDNRIANLAWGTKSENALDASRNGVHNNVVKTSCPDGHPYDDTNTIIYASGSRACRECGRIRSREYMRAKRADAKAARQSED